MTILSEYVGHPGYTRKEKPLLLSAEGTDVNLCSTSLSTLLLTVSLLCG